MALWEVTFRKPQLWTVYTQLWTVYTLTELHEITYRRDLTEAK